MNYVVATCKINPKPDSKRIHLITRSTAAAILGVTEEEIKAQHERELRGDNEDAVWGCGVVHGKPGEWHLVAEEILELAELWFEGEL